MGGPLTLGGRVTMSPVPAALAVCQPGHRLASLSHQSLTFAGAPASGCLPLRETKGP